MAYNLLLTVLIVHVSISLTSSYSHPTRDVLFKYEEDLESDLATFLYVYVKLWTNTYYFYMFRQDDDESYSMATSEQGALMIDVEYLVKARTFQALLAGSKVAVNKAYDSTSSKSNDFFFHLNKLIHLILFLLDILKRLFNSLIIQIKL